MKKNDIILGGVVIIIAVVFLIFINLTRNQTGDQIQITVNGTLYGTYSLDQDQTIEIEENGSYNRIRIADGKAYMEEADCPDGYCKEQGKISTQAQTIVCLPHKLVVEVIENGDTDNADEENMAPDVIAK